MKTTSRWLCAITLFVLSPLAAQTKSAGKAAAIDSVWDVTLQPTHSQQKEVRKSYIVVGSREGKLHLYSQDYSVAAEGLINGKDVEFNWKHASGDAVHLKLQPNAKAMLAGQEWHFQAMSLASVWSCDNHGPKYHLATTEEDMQNLTRDKKCEGWHKLQPPAKASQWGEILSAKKP